MDRDTIIKSATAENVPPNLPDYAQARTAYSWEAARRELDGLPGGRGLNIAHEAVDRRAAGSRKDRVALRWLAKTGRVEDFTYARLRSLTSRFANVLRSLGVARGDRVYALAGRIPELYVAALGTLKNRNVFCVVGLHAALGVEIPESDHPKLATLDGCVEYLMAGGR
jgi:acetyl-CoA synthetase